MESPLAGAVESGDVSQVIHLLNEGVDVNCPTGLNGETALMLAAYSGNIEILTFLLSSPNININQQDLSGQTALIIAAYQGHQEFVQYLISRQAVNPNLADYRGVTPLLAAILHGQTHVANTLLSLDTIDINCADLDTRTPLLAGEEKILIFLTLNFASTPSHLPGDAGHGGETGELLPPETGPGVGRGQDRPAGGQGHRPN